MNFWERENYDYGKKNNSGDSKNNSNGRGGYGSDKESNGGGYNSNGENRGDNPSAYGATDNKKQGGGSNPDFERFAADSINKYANMDESQLMSELMKTAGGMRSNGTLKSDDLENFYKSASAFLNTEQLAKLRMLINMLKSGD